MCNLTGSSLSLTVTLFDDHALLVLRNRVSVLVKWMLPTAGVIAAAIPPSAHVSDGTTSWIDQCCLWLGGLAAFLRLWCSVIHLIRNN